MKFSTKSDVVQLVKGLVEAIQPYAKSNQVHLQFKNDNSRLIFDYHPEQIIFDITQLLCNVIAFTPQSFNVEVGLEEKLINGIHHLIVVVKNDGASLARLGDIASDIENEIVIKSQNKKGTLFQLQFPIEKPEKPEKKSFSSKINHHSISPYYSEIRKQLRSHFANIENLEKAALLKSPREGVFLQKVNALILTNLGQEGYNTNCLCRGMALSRTQLYRKLKALTHIPPAHYIQFVRLQKAKEYLQNTDINVGEVVIKVGFASHSHFTRAFHDQFGINPSHLKQSNYKKET